MDFSAYNGASEEWTAFAATLPKQPFPPPDTSTAALLGVQAMANNAAIAGGTPRMAELAPKLLIKDHNIPARPGSKHTIPARSYQPLDTAYTNNKATCYIHLHGGGFMFGSLATDDPDCASLALAANVLVLSVDYRHTPAHPFPASWEDSEDAVEWVLSGAGAEVLGVDANKVVVGGPSAGAWLTASVVLGRHLQGKKNAAGQMLFIPAVVRSDCYEHVLKQLKDEKDSSMKVNADQEAFGRIHIDFFTDLLKFPPKDEAQLKDYRTNPGLATKEQVKGMPPTFVGCCGLDPLRDEGLLYAKTLAEAGVPTDIHVFPGVPHPFRLYTNLSEAKRSEKLRINGIAWALGKPAATNKFEVKTK